MMSSTAVIGATPAEASAQNNTGNLHVHRTNFIHMTFYWGHNVQVLFQGWPGTSSGMYALSLIFVFVLAVLVEWISHSSIIKPGTSNLVARPVRTAMHTVRSGLAYLVMLAVMSFNGGIFLAALGGHAVGFAIFRSRALLKSDGSGSEIRLDLPSMKC